MKRYFYGAPLPTFLAQSWEEILGSLVANDAMSETTYEQKQAWLFQIEILKKILKPFRSGHLYFEFTIPRIGKRIDNVFIYRDTLFLFEFKVGKSRVEREDLTQVMDYALDLKNFHEGSHQVQIVPLLLLENLKEEESIESLQNARYSDKLFKAAAISIDSAPQLIQALAKNDKNIHPKDWEESRYKPTPTIIEAAQRLYNGHSVVEISRSDAGAKNLNETTQAINQIIERSKVQNEKSIIFITGVPGAGKTLAGLNIASERQKIAEEEHAVFLSGNGPLVEVLREALARNERDQKGITLKEARRRVSSFIQNIHHFRDEYLKDEGVPFERVVIFDEAQRAWDREQTSHFMQRKRGLPEFNQSEPHFLISVMDRIRHNDDNNWSVIICLIGGGQEINKGEAGLIEWFRALEEFKEWNVYAPKSIRSALYLGEAAGTLKEALKEKLTIEPALHLAVSLRSFRSEALSDFVGALLVRDIHKAQAYLMRQLHNYPIFVTRDLSLAKGWLRKQARGSEQIGLVASSGAIRLRPYGIDVKQEIDAPKWFLNSADDIRSSNFLELAATEFSIQGLELDWVCIAWDADLRSGEFGWEFKNFRGTEWQNVNQEERQRYLLNTYRVLLTRARQGMIIFVPEGDEQDHTRQPQFYEGIFDYLISVGIPELKP